MTLLQDLRYGARQLRSNPGFTAVAVLSLALGIGANSAIFQLIDAVRMRTLPVAHPETLATVDFAVKSSRAGSFTSRSARLTSRHYEELKKSGEPFSSLIAWSADRFNLSPGGEARYAEGLYVSGDFFRTLGVGAVTGRTLTADDDQPGCSDPGAVLSYGFWQREFGGDAGAVGRAITLDGRRFPIVGVAPATFLGVEPGSRFDVAIPLCADSQQRHDGAIDYWLSVIGRLKPGWTIARANGYIQAISPAFMQATVPAQYKPDLAKRYLQNQLTVTEGGTGVSQARQQFTAPLVILQVATLLVLLIACANVANLLLARASVRERELAIRQAIGASRSRLIVQLLSESLLLAALGTALGLALAQSVSRVLVALLSTPGTPLFLDLTLDARVVVFTAGIATAACLIFGLLPAFRATRVQPVSAMRASGRGMTSGRERFALRRGLVTAQVALSLVLLVGALLFAGSLRNILAVDPGFRADGLVVASMDLRGGHFPKDQLRAVERRIEESLRSAPGIAGAAQVEIPPISGNFWNGGVQLVVTDAPRMANFNRVSPGYFRTTGTALIAGRDFDDRDTAGAPTVAIVNEKFARTYFGGANPVGRTFRVQSQAGKPDSIYEIVGVVRNAAYNDLREGGLSIAYLASAQDENPNPGPSYIVRVAGNPGAALDAVKAAVADVNRGIVIEFHVMSQQIRDSLARERLMAALAGAFGVLAALLAIIGLYGVVSYMVARRRNEIGVRIALGAGRGSVIAMVLREAAVLLGAGLVVGTGLGILAMQAARTMLFGLEPYDPAAFAGAIALLAAVGLLASYAPALRAARVEPVQALRED